ncbi:unnamed protein product [Blepharisma stoltei]|uniref:Ras-related protein Rab-7b n=1 Tax=Blepharisma stoltei TaxID=1481888 RepID=A0AAU9JU24_9CILI|nr:unnamed protein product [Blepharisma stoltei]
MATKRYQQKIIVLGDSGVGKTSLLNRYVRQEFSQNYRATIGADFLSKEITVDDRHISLQLWDTAGQERFQSLGMAFYRGADCCLLVYDMTNLKSFQSLANWRDEFLKQSSPNDPATFPFIVLGNKSDLVNERVVSEAMAQQWAKENDLILIEVSAKEGKSVEEGFQEGARKAMKREQQSQPILKPAINLKKNNQTAGKKKSCCK